DRYTSLEPLNSKETSDDHLSTIPPAAAEREGGAADPGTREHGPDAGTTDGSGAGVEGDSDSHSAANGELVLAAAETAEADQETYLVAAVGDQTGLGVLAVQDRSTAEQHSMTKEMTECIGCALVTEGFGKCPTHGSA